MKIMSLMMLFASSQAFASTVVSVPARDLLDAARKIVPQTGPAYRVSGNLVCQAIASQLPPYQDRMSCTIEVEGVRAKVKNPQLILNELMAAQERTGPAYRVQGKFEAQSIGSELPPYSVTESAQVELSK